MRTMGGGASVFILEELPEGTMVGVGTPPHLGVKRVRPSSTLFPTLFGGAVGRPLAEERLFGDRAGNRVGAVRKGWPSDTPG